MKPIRPGDRGPAVEDIQRRLRTLGYEIGPTGVDGVFFGMTADAVREFQSRVGLAEDSLVGDETWAALVDATFTIGDRMLYLRLPYFHGRDVSVLQGALGALGFACGAHDGIFGPFTEAALAEFQRNTGLVPDGIAGDESVAAILALRHVWEGKDPRAHSAARVASARAEAVLERLSFAVAGMDATGTLVAERIVNLARATSADARVRMLDDDERQAPGARFILRVCGHGTVSAPPGRPVVRLDAPETLAARLLTALESIKDERAEVMIELETDPGAGEHALQRAAVQVLDAVCRVFD